MRRILALAATLALATGLLGPVQTVLAAAPANDNLADASVVTALPFTTDTNNTEATTEPNEPSGCGQSLHTVWYAMTPLVGGVFHADMAGTSFGDTALSVYTAASPDITTLAQVANGCWFWGTSAVTFQAQAGSTYYFQVGDTGSGSGNLHLSITRVPPPDNDDFANAIQITSLPFTNAFDPTASSLEAGEPIPSCVLAQNSVWYRIDPLTSDSLTVTLPDFWTSVAAYSGDTLATLTQLGCKNYSGPFTFAVQAGGTYYLQIVPLLPFGSGVLHVNVDVAPPPQASFYAWPYDPSIFDAVQFGDNSYDPAGVGVATRAWDFGDGSTSADPSPTHRFTADGDYTVKLSIATFDGRTSSSTQIVKVATHDVTITKFTVPTSAIASQTRPISVGISDLRYPETVQVTLLRSNASGGFDVVGTLTQAVPVRAAGRTTPFNFTYTFTKADATLGKVSFRAEAAIRGYRDALPADNVVIALPTKVLR